MNLGLTDGELKLLIACVGLIGIAIGAVLNGIGFFTKRWVSGAKNQENISYLSSVAEFAAKLRTTGMTVAEVDDLERLLRSPRVGASTTALAVIAARPADQGDERFASTFAMRERAAAAYQVADAELGRALVDLRLLTEDLDIERLDFAQRAWAAYRTELMASAAEEYRGGSQAPLAAILAGIAETERRMHEIRSNVRERLDRGEPEP